LPDRKYSDSWYPTWDRGKVVDAMKEMPLVGRMGPSTFGTGTGSLAVAAPALAAGWAITDKERNPAAVSMTTAPRRMARPARLRVRLSASVLMFHDLPLANRRSVFDVDVEIRLRAYIF
jgi:hypothetical protein